MARVVRAVMSWTVILFLSIAAAQAGQVTLAWNASAGATGYQVHYGTASGSYTNNANAGNTTTYTVANLADGKTYYFAVKAYDAAGNQSGFSNEVSQTLAAVAPAPVANFSADKTSGVAPLAVKFTDQSTGSVTGWCWKFGITTTSTCDSTVQNPPSQTYSTAKTYTVSLVVTGPGGTSPATTKTITVNAPTAPAPVANFTVNPTSQGGTTATIFTFADRSTGTVTGWSWDFKDGTKSDLQKPDPKQFTKAGTYNVTLTVSPGGSTAQKSITVTDAPPLAEFGVNSTSGSTSTTFIFTDNSKGTVTSRSWKFTNSTDNTTDTSTAQNPERIFSKPGTYTVSLTATGPGGSDTNTKTNYISVSNSLLTRDIGNVGVAGSASHANQIYTLKGSGADIWGTADAFRFVYQPLNGNGTIVARVASLTNTDSWAKAGVMIRESLNPNSKHAMVVVTPGNGMAFQRRTATGGTSYHSAGATVKAPYWVKLTRSGKYFYAYQSKDGTNWTQVGSRITLSMATSVYVGLALTSHNNSALATATLDNVSIQ